MNKNRTLLAGLSQLPGIKNTEYKNLILEDKLPFAKERLLKLGENFLSKTKANIIFLGEDLYPKLLFELPDPPKYLYYKGPIHKVNWDFAVSIVGTRIPSDYGIYVTRDISKRLSKYGVHIVSGLAYGIDRVAQLVCSDQNCITVGVLGEGIESWQSCNKGLVQNFGENLVLISEYPPSYPAAKHTFPQRNRIIAGLVSKTIVIEAPEKSGALITAQYALDYDREIFAVPHMLSSLKGRGCNNLIHNNEAMLLRGIEDILMSFSEIGTSSIREYTYKNLSDMLEKKIVKILKKREVLSVNDIALELKTDLATILPRLTKLESDGILTRSLSNRYKLNSLVS